MARLNHHDGDSTTSTELFLPPLLPLSEDTVVGVVDYKRRPAVRSEYGRWRSASFIIVAGMAERTAYYGISSNLITFMTGELGQSTAMAAANVNAWSGVACLLPILGAVIADSYLGKYYTILVSSLIYILGMCLLTLSATMPSRTCDNPPGCSANLQIITFFVALYLVAAGQGGSRPCVQAFGADQFDGEDAKESKSKSTFFNWWYFAACFGSLLGKAVLRYVQDDLSWALGFGIPCIIMVFSLVIFLFATVTYRYTMESERQSPFKRIGRVFAAAARNWHAIDHGMPDDKEEAHETPSPEGSCHFRFLDKALLPHDIYKGDGQPCSIEEVEEAKSALGLFPIWSTSLVFATINSQQGTFFTKQGATLDRSIGASFIVPAASLQCLTSISIILFIPIYDRIIVPFASVFTGKPSGITTLQRVGIGLFISIFSMIIAAFIEQKRLKTAFEFGLIDSPNVTIPMSVWWLVPQYALFGIAESFTMVGLQELFYGQVPHELSSVGLSLYLSVFGTGSLLSSLLVSVIDKATSRGGGESWFSNNMNRAHIDYFYWLIAAFSMIGLALFINSANSYKYRKITCR